MSAAAAMLVVAVVVSAEVVVEAVVVAAAAGVVATGVVGSAVDIVFVVAEAAVGLAPGLEALGLADSFESNKNNTAVANIFNKW